MNLKNIVIAILIITVGGLLIWRFQGKNTPEAKALDPFAQCLADKGATMYGASWCKYCNKEKEAFGSSFKYVPYVECPENAKLCLEKGVDGYPTWFIGDKKLVGLQGLGNLAKETGCELPSSEQIP